VQSCDNYCTLINKNCTGATNGQFAAATAAADCAKACKTYPAGTGADQSGDTLGCRIYHADKAAQVADVHCPHAGPFGGTAKAGNLVCGPGTDAGVSAAYCEAFCNLAVAACPKNGATPGPWADVAACKTDCDTYTVDAAKPLGAADYQDKSDTFNCRSYHLTAALSTPAPHCGHLGPTSPVCNQ
jgi:hypothetical protein